MLYIRAVQKVHEKWNLDFVLVPKKGSNPSIWGILKNFIENNLAWKNSAWISKDLCPHNLPFDSNFAWKFLSTSLKFYRKKKQGSPFGYRYTGRLPWIPFDNSDTQSKAARLHVPIHPTGSVLLPATLHTWEKGAWKTRALCRGEEKPRK